MNTQSDTYPDHQLLQYDKLRSRFAAGHNTYVSATPFPHIILDNFIRSDLTDTILTQLTQSVMDSLTNIPDLFKLSPTIRQLIWELNSSTFIRALEGLTGLHNLIPDPALRGGGIQIGQNGQVPLLHATPMEENPYGLQCRLKLELYLNKDWKDEYEGHLELWNCDLSACVKRIRPTAGRCVIFSLNTHTYHGQSLPFECPNDVTKKYIAVYYYTLDRNMGIASLADTQKLAESELPPPQ